MSETEIDVEQQPVGNAFARAVDRILEPRVLGPVIGTLAVALALFVIHEISGKVHLHQNGAAIAATPRETVISSLFLTMISFGALALYDVLAVRRVVLDKAGRPVQLLMGQYRPDRYEYRMELSPMGGGDSANVWVENETRTGLRD